MISITLSQAAAVLQGMLHGQDLTIEAVTTDTCILVFGFQAVIGGIMRASGVVLVPMGITIFCVLCIELPVAYALNAHFGLEGVWMAFPVTYIAMLGLQTAYYRLVWRHKQIQRLV